MRPTARGLLAAAAVLGAAVARPDIPGMPGSSAAAAAAGDPLLADAPPGVASFVVKAGGDALGRMAPLQPTLNWLHPRNGSVVNAGYKVVFDLSTPGFKVPADGYLCVEMSAPDSSSSRGCFEETSAIFVTLQEPGQYRLTGMLVKRDDVAGPPSDHDLAARTLATSTVYFNAEDHTTCDGKFGRPPCGVHRRHCSLFTKFRFYLYPMDTANTRQEAHLYHVLRESLLRTDAPEEACIFIGVGEMNVANVLTTNMYDASRFFTRLPYWGAGGENHLLFHFADYAPLHDTGRAMLAKSSFGKPMNPAFFNPSDPGSVPQMAAYRPGYDVIAPFPFYRCNMGDFTHLERYLPRLMNGTIPPMAARSHLLTFKGAIYRSYEGHHMHVRHALKGIHNGADVLIGVTCSQDSVTCDAQPKAQRITTFSHPNCDAWTAEANAMDFDDLVLNSRFSAIVPGEGTHSYRLYEALAGGSIPVLIGQSVKPLERLIAWDKISITWEDESPEGLANLVAFLRSIPEAKLTEMQMIGAVVFTAHFRDLPTQVHSVLAEVSHRFADLDNEMIAAGVLRKADKAYVQEGAGDKKATAPAAEATPAATPVAGTPTPVPATPAPQKQEAKPPVLSTPAAATPTPTPAAAPPAATTDADTAALANPRLLSLLGDAHGLLSGYGNMLRKEADLRSGEGLNPNADGTASLAWSASTQWDTMPLRTGINLLLRWIQNAVPTQAARMAAGNILSKAYLSLSQSYSLLGHWRLAESAATAMMLQTQAEEVNTAVLTARVRNSIVDARRPPGPASTRYTHADAMTVAGDYGVAQIAEVYQEVFGARQAAYMSRGTDGSRAAVVAVLAANGASKTDPGSASAAATTPAEISALLDAALLGSGYEASLVDDLRSSIARIRQRLYRVSEDLSDNDGSYLSGYGDLAHFLAPAPLMSVDAPGAAVLPISPCIAPAPGIPTSPKCLSDTTHPDTVLPYTAVSEDLLQDVAAQLHGALPERYPAFSGLYPNVTGFLSGRFGSPSAPTVAGRGGGPKAKKNGPRIAIASICAYGNKPTKLAELSMANLKAYCETHGYDCYMGSESLDPTRPTAWSKVILVSQLLPHYDWVMWRDCDSFFMNSTVTIEGMLASAGKARSLVAAAAASTLAGAGELSPYNDFCGPAEGESASDAAIPAWSSYTGIAPSSILSSSSPRHIRSPAFNPATAVVGASSMDLVLSEDGFMLNTGIFFVRNSPWSRSMLRRIYGVQGVEVEGPAPFGRGWCVPARNTTAGKASRVPLTRTVPPEDPAAEADGVAAAMRATQLPFDKNKAWEQACVFAELAQRSVTVLDDDALAGARAGETLALDPELYADAVHTQMLPQAWINSYPLEIAAKLHDHRSRPLHAPYVEGDWIVSFSGCGTLLGDAICEQLFAAYAAAAK